MFVGGLRLRFGTRTRFASLMLFAKLPTCSGLAALRLAAFA